MPSVFLLLVSSGATTSVSTMIFMSSSYVRMPPEALNSSWERLFEAFTCRRVPFYGSHLRIAALKLFSILGLEMLSSPKMSRPCYLSIDCDPDIPYMPHYMCCPASKRNSVCVTFLRESCTCISPICIQVRMHTFGILTMLE